jgi:hypothetical protein
MPKQVLSICAIVLVAASTLFAATCTAATAGAKQTKRRGETTGPTVYLDYEDQQQQKDNSVEAFMYFVPMVSTVLVDSTSSANNSQKARIVACRQTTNDEEFEAVCRFVMRGRGWQENFFDADDIVAKDRDFVPRGKALKHVIEYIRFEGSGRGRVEVKGRVIDGVEKVTNVTVVFNDCDSSSPVTVGLYSMRPEDGQYKFENRYDMQKARVNSISFKATDSEPTMEIELASLESRNAGEGFCSRLKARIANFFIPPIRINPEGNKAMLDFGYALYKKQASFTFPKARNLKMPQNGNNEETVVAKADDKQKPAAVKPD